MDDTERTEETEGEIARLAKLGVDVKTEVVARLPYETRRRLEQKAERK